MALIEVDKEPTRRQLIVFALLLIAFGGLFGALVSQRPELLLILAIVSSMATVLKTFFDPEQQRNTRWYGWIVPVGAVLSYAFILAGFPIWIVTAVVWVSAVAAATTILTSHTLGQSLYAAWLLAFLPLGWTMSHTVLAIVYYGVMTPIGMAMRLVGHDPLQRKPDPSVDTYWIEKTEKPGVDRYFRQF